MRGKALCTRIAIVGSGLSFSALRARMLSSCRALGPVARAEWWLRGLSRASSLRPGPCRTCMAGGVECAVPTTAREGRLFQPAPAVATFRATLRNFGLRSGSTKRPKRTRSTCLSSRRDGLTLATSTVKPGCSKYMANLGQPPQEHPRSDNLCEIVHLAPIGRSAFAVDASVRRCKRRGMANQLWDSRAR